jgi:anti-sigma factor RsiW
MNEPWEKSAESRALWRQWMRASEQPADAFDELTLAAYAEGRLDPATQEAVTAYLAHHPALAEDIVLARGVGNAGVPGDRVGDGHALAIARASALVPAFDDRVIAFRQARRVEPSWRFAARWGALAASFAMVSYLGFALGSDASSVLASLDRSAAGISDELLDPPTGFIGGISDVGGT